MPSTWFLHPPGWSCGSEKPSSTLILVMRSEMLLLNCNNTRRLTICEANSCYKGKIDPQWPFATQLEDLLEENKSLDEVFQRACIAVLLTYDSDCLGQHISVDSAYEAAFEKEIRKHHATFASKNLPKDIAVHLILLPLNTKANLLAELDTKLKAWQTI